MSQPLKKTYIDYIDEGYELAFAYYADGHHIHVLKAKDDVVISSMPHDKVISEGFMFDEHVQITRFMK